MTAQIHTMPPRHARDWSRCFPELVQAIDTLRVDIACVETLQEAQAIYGHLAAVEAEIAQLTDFAGERVGQLLETL